MTTRANGIYQMPPVQFRRVFCVPIRADDGAAGEPATLSARPSLGRTAQRAQQKLARVSRGTQPPLLARVY